MALATSRLRFHLLEGRLSQRRAPFRCCHQAPLAQCRHHYLLLVARKVEDYWLFLTLVLISLHCWELSQVDQLVTGNKPEYQAVSYIV